MVKLFRVLHNLVVSDEQVPAGISAEEWAATPPSVRLWVETRLQRLAALEERVNQNSHNSSQPPSSDPPNLPPRPPRPPSGRPRGGQPGHAGYARARKSLAQVERVVELRPSACQVCGTLLLGEDPQPQCHQVTELPRVEPHLTEYRRHTLTWLACRAQTPAAWPSDMPSGNFGPRLQATPGYLSGGMSMSPRDIEETLDTLFHADLSLGSVPAPEVAVSAALAQPVREAQIYVQRQPATNVDETGWHEQSQRAWLWVCATPLVAVFLVLTTRSAQGLKPLLGEAFHGIVGSDRWSAYNGLKTTYLAGSTPSDGNSAGHT